MSIDQMKTITMDTFYRLSYPEGASHMDGFPDHLRDVVHDHWGTFPPQHPLVVDLFGIFFFILTVASLFGNGLVIYVFLTTKSLRTPTNMFIINLALADVGVMLTQGPLMFINAFASDFWMWGSLLCKLYAVTGGIFGVAAILTMVAIGYDRYNVIVKGFSGKKITPTVAFITIVGIWCYACAVCCPPFLGWGGYKLEGLFMSCSFDYLSEDWNHKSFVLYAFVCNYCCPMLMVIFFYSQIVKAVVAHESALKAQAKKMNVESLRSNTDENADSAEVRIAKVAITNVTLWVTIWSPYAFVVMMAAFGDRNLVTPMVSQLPSFLCKLASVINPFIFALSHPKFREALGTKCSCLGMGDKPPEKTEAKTVAATA